MCQKSEQGKVLKRIVVEGARYFPFKRLIIGVSFLLIACVHLIIFNEASRRILNLLHKKIIFFSELAEIMS